MDKEKQQAAPSGEPMDGHKAAFDQVKTAVEGIARLRNIAFEQYTILVDEVITNRITDQREIERVMDGLLDFGDDLEFLDLYKKICRHVFYTYPEMVGEHVALWRMQFADSEESEEDV